MRDKKMKADRLPAISGGKPAFDHAVPITMPTLPDPAKLIGRYKNIIKSGMLTNASTVKEFEARAAEYLKVDHAVALNSCTSGLMLTMKIFQLKGEVIIPSFTFHATAHAVVWNGLTPVFVDCNPETYNLDPEQVKKVITPRTSAILGVHLFGNPANVEALSAIARQHNLKLIFDAAHGFGAKRGNKHVGGFGDAESFSLSPTKLLTSGEGGIVGTNDRSLAAELRIARNYGDSGDYDCAFSGFNARMSEFNALMGIETLKLLEKNVERRNKLVELYKEKLAGIPGINFQAIDPGDRSTFKDFSICIDENKFGIDRDALYDALLAEKIIVKKYFYPPVHAQKVYKHLASDQQKLSNTVRITSRVLSLPLYSHLDSKTISIISAAVRAIHEYKRSGK